MCLIESLQVHRADQVHVSFLDFVKPRFSWINYIRIQEGGKVEFTLKHSKSNSCVLIVGHSWYRSCYSLTEAQGDIILDKPAPVCFVYSENEFSFLQYMSASPLPRDSSAETAGIGNAPPCFLEKGKLFLPCLYNKLNTSP